MAEFPVIERELRVAARGKGIYLSRYVAAGLAGAGAAFALLWAAALSELSGTPGVFLFYFNSAIAALYCFGAGLFWTLDCISREQREGTLGLLFLTRLGSFEVVAGKIVANGVPAFFSFLTVFPLIALSFCLGGVNPKEFAVMTVALLNLLSFSLILATFVSSTVTNPGPAILLFFSAMLLPSTVGYGGMFWFRTSEIAPTWLAFNPLYPVALAFGLNLSEVPKNFFGMAILTTQMLNIVLLFGAAFLMERSVRVRDRWSAMRFSQSVTRGPSRKRRQAALETHPVMYLGLRRSGQQLYILSFLVLGVILYYNDPLAAINSEYRGLLYPLLLHYILKWLLAWESGRALLLDRRNGFFEILLVTPTNPGIILRGQKLALRRQFLVLLLVTLAVHLVILSWSINQFGLTTTSWIIVASMIILFVDFFCLSWIGLWQGLVHRSSHRAFIGTLIFGLALPWLPFLVFFGLVWFVLKDDFTPSPVMLASWGIVLSSVFAFAFGLWGLAQAHFRFRSRVTQYF
jgi:hypothetical protein